MRFLGVCHVSDRTDLALVAGQTHRHCRSGRAPGAGAATRRAIVVEQQRLGVVPQDGRAGRRILRALRGMPAPSRPRFVTTMHGLNSPGRYSAVMTRGERVICVSDTVRRYLLQHYPRTDPDRLVVIPRGIDPAQFPRAPLPDPAARAWAAAQHPALAGGGPLLLLPGRGTRLKGHHAAIALLGRLQGAGIQARLWMPGAREAGREPYVLELEAEARRAGCAQALVITPPTTDIARAYAASDVVLRILRERA